MTTTNSTNNYSIETELQQCMRKCKRLEIENGGQKRKMIVYQGNTRSLSKLLAVGGMGTTFKQIKANASSEVHAALSAMAMTYYVNSCVWERNKMLPPTWVE